MYRSLHTSVHLVGGPAVHSENTFTYTGELKLEALGHAGLSAQGVVENRHNSGETVDRGMMSHNKNLSGNLDLLQTPDSKICVSMSLYKQTNPMLFFQKVVYCFTIHCTIATISTFSIGISLWIFPQ
jgi:hypothetical protein